jgi:hypothetical protein
MTCVCVEPVGATVCACVRVCVSVCVCVCVWCGRREYLVGSEECLGLGRRVGAVNCD